MEKDPLVDVAGDQVACTCCRTADRVRRAIDEPHADTTKVLNARGTIAQFRGTCGVRADLIALDEVAVAACEGRRELPISMPSTLLPEITLPAPAPVPPIVFFDVPLSIITP